MSDEEKFVCPLPKVPSLEEWWKRGETKENCPPCLLLPLASYYVGTLEERGLVDQANRLKEVHDKANGDGLPIAIEMDRIKKEVPPEVLKELEDFDCMAVTFKEGE